MEDDDDSLAWLALGVFEKLLHHIVLDVHIDGTLGEHKANPLVRTLLLIRAERTKTLTRLVYQLCVDEVNRRREGDNS